MRAPRSHSTEKTFIRFMLIKTKTKTAATVKVEISWRNSMRRSVLSIIIIKTATRRNSGEELIESKPGPASTAARAGALLSNTASTWHPRINQSINQSIKQRMDESINQSINQSIERWMDESMNQSINQSINRSIERWMDESMNQSINQSIDR